MASFQTRPSLNTSMPELDPDNLYVDWAKIAHENGEGYTFDRTTGEEKASGTASGATMLKEVLNDFMDKRKDLKEFEEELKKNKDMLTPGQVGES